jgi:hypothetical protein
MAEYQTLDAIIERSDIVRSLRAELAAEQARADALVLAVTHQGTSWPPEIGAAIRAILDARGSKA